MRNAAAAFDDDYASDEPVRRAKPARKARGAKKKSGRRSFGGRPVFRYAAIGLSASLAIGIMVNALVMQHSRHPAPLFGKAIVLGDAPAPIVPSPAPAAPATAAPAAAAASPAAPSVVPPQPVARPHHVASEGPVTARSGHDDPIAKLLKTATAGADKAASDKAAPRESAKTVLATQHALVKLGFVVKPTGAFGPGTKSAIEAFERDQHLPVKGEMSRRVLKQISAESGVAID